MAPTKTQVFIKANSEGFDKVTAEISKMTQAFENMATRSPRGILKVEAAVKDLSAVMEKQAASLDKLAQGFTNLGDSSSRFSKKLTMDWNLGSIAKDMELMFAAQLRWYGAKAVWDMLTQAPVDAGKALISYAATLDDARASFERWLVVGGATRDSVKGQVDAMMDAVRIASTTMPLSTKDIGAAVEPFVGAGIETSVIPKMIPDIVKLKSAFKEIDMNQFALAIVGAFNAFKDKLGEGLTEAEKFRRLMDQIMAASAVGVIRPENFTKVIQYLGQIGSVAGFTTDELFAMSSALVNVSIPAANASRLLGGLFVSITRSKSVDELNKLGSQIGFQIDRTKNLKGQWDDILKLLNLYIKQGGSLEKIEFLGKIVPSDRLKVLYGLATQLDETQRILNAIRGAEGKGLDISAEVAKAPLSAQWIIFKNIISEIGTTLGTTGGSLQKFMTTVVDVGRGVLVAFDSTGKFKGQLNDLGLAGSKAYDVMIGVKEVFSKLIDILTPFGTLLAMIIDGWLKLTAALAHNKEIFNLVLDVILALGIGALGTFVKGLIAAAGETSKFAALLLPVGEASSKVIPWLTKMGEALLAVGRHLTKFLLILVSGQWKLFADLFTDMSLSVKGLSAAFSTLGATLLRFLSNPVTLLIVGLEGISFAFKQLNAEMDKMDARDKALWSTKYTKESIGPAIKAKLDELNKFTEADIYQRPNEYNELRYQLAYLRSQERALNQPIEKPTTKKIPEIKTPKDVEKGLGSDIRSQISSVTGDYRDLLSEERIEMEESAQLLQDKYKLGEISAEEYYEKIKTLSIKSWNNEQDLIAKWNHEINQLYTRLIGTAKTEEERKAIDKAWEKSIRDMDKKVKETKKHQSTVESKANRERIEANYKLEEIAAKAEADRAKALSQQMEAIELASIERRKANLEQDYAYRRVGAYEYYTQLEELVKKDADIKLRNIDEETNAQEDAILRRMDFLEDNNQTELAEYKELTAKLSLLDVQRQTNRLKVEEETKNKINEIRLRTIKDVDYQLNKPGGGYVSAFGEAFDQVIAEFPSKGAQILSMAKGLATALTDTFEDLFFDTFQGKLKSLGDYINAFILSVQRTLAQVLSQQLTAGLLGQGTIVGDLGKGMASGVGSFLEELNLGALVGVSFHQGGIVGQTGGPLRIVPSAAFVGAQRMHDGWLGADEVPAILQRGEIVLSRRDVSRLSEAQGAVNNNVEVNIINKSGQPLTGKMDSAPRIDHRKLILDIVVEGYDSYAPLRNKVTSMRL